MHIEELLALLQNDEEVVLSCDGFVFRVECIKRDGHEPAKRYVQLGFDAQDVKRANLNIISRDVEKALWHLRRKAGAAPAGER